MRGGQLRGGARGGLYLSWWAISPAILILVVPLGFRFTCYYYRKAYYRSFWGSPPACAVADGHRRYGGESRFPLVLENLHRYFFVAGLGTDRAASLPIEAVIRVAHGLDLSVVAEGVETATQLDTLCNLGCDAAQGYLLARPVPDADLPSAVERARQAASR